MWRVHHHVALRLGRGWLLFFRFTLSGHSDGLQVEDTASAAALRILVSFGGVAARAHPELVLCGVNVC